MDETDDFIDECKTASQLAAAERLRLQLAFGDDVAQRFLRLRGIEGDAMQEAVLEKYAAKQALKITRDALALAAAQQAPRLFAHTPDLRLDDEDAEISCAGDEATLSAGESAL